MNKSPQIKVCGNRDPENIRAMAELGPDYLGFIFYPQSKRFVSWESLNVSLNTLPSQIRTVGVFVNQDLETILEISGHLKLNILQLHGTEGVEMGRQLKEAGYRVWKVFGLGSETPDWKKMEPWLEASDAFLFDTQSPAFGGTGQPFDHQILETYPFEKPFFLSGGIGPDFRSLPARMENLPLLGFDINSRFESQPGIKKVAEVSGFIEFWRSEKQ